MTKLTNTIKGIFSAIGSIIFILFILVMWSANIRSCFTSEKINKSELSSDIRITKASPNNPKHQRILTRLTKIYSALELIEQDEFDVYFINDSSSMNAASFGNSIFLFWETLADLPDWAIDSVLAHEMAHDLLLHSRKMRDADDVRNFFTEVLSLLGGADRKTEKTLHDWSTKLTLPQYSQKQEYEADKYSVQILYVCGYDNSEIVFANTLKYIKDNYGDSGGGSLILIHQQMIEYKKF